MAEKAEWMEEFYKGLVALNAYSFPKICSNCGKTYQTLDDFLAEAEEVQHRSGLIEYTGRDEESVVGLFRNCSCHSTLMSKMKDRRDVSEAGERARSQFDRLLKIMTAVGITQEEARRELLKIMHGEDSRMLKKWGFDIAAVRQDVTNHLPAEE